MNDIAQVDETWSARKIDKWKNKSIITLRQKLALVYKMSVKMKLDKEPLYNKVLIIANDFLYPSNLKIYEKESRYNETSLYS